MSKLVKGFRLGQKFKSYAAWDIHQEGEAEVLEVVEMDGELAFKSEKDGSFFDLNFLGTLVPIP